MKPRSLTASSFIVVLILTAGVFMGVTLVKQEQDIRNRAAELKEHKVAICHKTESETNSWVQVEISKNALDTHLAHGDIQANCPVEAKKDGDGEDKKDEEHVGGVSLASSVNVVNQTQSPAEIVVETKYVYITTSFDFKIKFQGIDEKKDDKIVRVIFRKGEEELHVYNNVVVTSDANGIYRGTITDVRPGTFDVLIKSDGFLQRKFEDISLSRGRNSYNWSKTELLAGDFNNDNQIDSKDIAEFFSFYNYELNPIDEENRVFDVNMVGFLNLEDIEIVFENYQELVVEGDN